MMFITNTSIRSMTGVLLSLCLLSSCDKPSPVPKDVIRSASQNWAPDEPGEQIDFIAGEPLISDGNFGVKGKPIYPVRTVFQVKRKVPVSWDKLTGLPYLPQESETARAYVELEYTANEFGEWSSRYRGKGWIDPEKKPGFDEPQPRDREAFAARRQQGVEQVDMKLLERLLEESQKKDELNGGIKSRETIVHEAWVSGVKDMKMHLARQAELEEERLRAEEEHDQVRLQKEESERLKAQQRLDEQAAQQRNWERLLREVREEQQAAKSKPLPPAPDPMVEMKVQAEIEEALKFVSTSLMNRDGHTVDEFLKMKGWAYPAKIREAVEQALQEAEDQYAASHGNTSQSRREFKQAQQQDKARRYRQAEQDPEFRKMKAGQPFENGYRALHYWMPVEFSASQNQAK